jgi:hypothetical protein
MSASGELAERAPSELFGRRVEAGPPFALAVAGALVALWLIADPRTPDLAAQVYRVSIFEHFGPTIWDSRWYGGHYLPGYSLLFPPFAALAGLRVVAALSVLASTILFERLTLGVYGPRARWGAAFFALAAVADIWSGRLTFALGVSFALGAVLALVRGRVIVSIALAALCAAASPVAGALLALAGVTHALYTRSPRAALTLALPTIAVIAPLVALFPEGGVEPYPILSFGATVVVVIAFLCVLPPRQPLLRVGAIVYLLVCVACLLVHTPIGSNIERYAALLAGPLLVCALLARRGRSTEGERPGSPALAAPRGQGVGASGSWGGRSPRAGSSSPALAPALALALIALFVAWGPVRETFAVAGNESTFSSYYAPVERFVEQRANEPIRLEVPLTRSHWEAGLLAPSVSLARGWEKQLDTRFNRPLLEPGLGPSAYESWLHDQAVSYVALPDTPLDPSSAQEGRLIRRGVPYLREVFASRHWRIYAVRSPTPLASGPGRVSSLGHDSFTLRAFSAGAFLVRVHFTRFWTFTQGAGCVTPAPGGWTALTLGRPGTVTVAARFSLARALGLEGRCQR